VTLILTRVSPRGALQVTDRLVTFAKGDPFDILANKNILYICRDAAVTIGYTGVAYIDRVPTDVFIAQQLSGLDLKKLFSVQVGLTPNQFRIFEALQTLKRVLEGILPKGPQLGFELIVAGFQRLPRRVIPIFAVISYSLRGTTKLSFLPRHVSKLLQREKVYFQASPGQNFPPHELSRLGHELQSSGTPERAEKKMARAIQRISSTNPYVGSDCMSIFLGAKEDGSPLARVRFLPSAQHAMEVSVEAERHRTAIAYSPWILSPSLVLAPSVMAGGWAAKIGSWTVELNAPESSVIRGLLKAQTRPLQPR
jgi:hypothetical protein